MKGTKRITAILAAAFLLVFSFVTAFPVMDAYAAGTSSLTINGINNANAHSFELYQIMSGEYKTDGTASDMRWGTGLTSYKVLSAHTDAGYTQDQVLTVTPGTVVDPVLLYEIVNTGDLKSDKTALISRLTLKDAGKVEQNSVNGSVTFSNLDTGYYLVKDVTTGLSGDDAISGDMLVYVNGSMNANVKTVKPEFNKQVSEDGTTDNWTEVADYNIGDTVKFRLTATIPQSENLKAYGSYKLVFTDEFSDGVTFGSIDSVTVDTDGAGGAEPTAITSYVAETNADGYKLAATPGEGTQTGFTLELTDLEKNVTSAKWGLSSGDIEVTVIYTATLNAKAPAITASVNAAAYADKTQVTVNGAKITYSNDPANADSVGNTAVDNVGIFTYKMENIKYANLAQAGYELNGAKFSIHRDTAAGTKVDVIYDTSLNAYRPILDGETAADYMITGYNLNDGGKLNIAGLDEGTYVLVEDAAPEGYTKIADLTFTITSTLSESADFTAAKAQLVMTGITALTGNNLIDTLTSNKPLPSTGGIGTTIFYLIGSILVIGSGVILITKRRIGAVKL